MTKTTSNPSLRNSFKPINLTDLLRYVITNVKGRRFLVIGDVILDEYVEGEVNRISPEAPVPVVLADPKRSSYRLGGAANVAHNLRSLSPDSTVDILSSWSTDEEGDIVRAMLFGLTVGTKSLPEMEDYITTVKTRILGNGQQLVRIDKEVQYRLPWDQGTMSDLCSIVQDYDGIVISDYGKGVVNSDLLTVLGELSEVIWIGLDPKPSNDSYCWLDYPFDVITPNLREAQLLSGKPTSDLSEIFKSLSRGRDKGINVLVTLGEDGMALNSDDNEGYRLFPQKNLHPVADVSGAGDTVIAAIALAQVGGLDWYDSIEFANAAAGISVGKHGTSVVTLEELFALAK